MPLRLPPTESPARTDFVETVHRILVDAITDGSLAPGERITQEEIAEQLSVSRSPVLQALRLLKQEGLIEDAPGRGVQVAPLDPQWIANLYEVRGALDALAARRAAELKFAIDPDIIRRGREAASQMDLRAIVDADLAFHYAIYQATGNPLIAESANRYWVHLRRVIGAVHRASRQRADMWDEHQAIADAIAQGDAERAVLLTELHVRRARTNVVRRLDELLSAQAGPKAEVPQAS